MSHRVWLFSNPVGRLATSRGRLTFTYDGDAAERSRQIPLSVRLPHRAEPYGDEAARAFFENLLPEEEYRALVAATLRIADRDVAGLLGAIGGECAGAVSIWPEGSAPPETPGYRPLAAGDLKGIFSVPDDPRLVEAHREGRLSLAGAQEKLTVRRHGSQWQLPLEGAPATHILKRTRVAVPRLVENEFFCTRLAAAAGLPVPEVEYIDVGIPLLVVQRFDRRLVGDAVERLHQEDFCQATGAMPAAKYEAEGGPGLADCAAVIRRHSALPLGDLPLLVQWVAFNYVIGNEDAHAKNLALLYTDQGIRLAPFYDLASSIVYRGLSRKAAMGIGGERRYAYVEQRHWQRFAEGVGLSWRATVPLVAATTGAVETGLERALSDAAASFGELELVAAIGAGIRERIERLRGIVSA